VRVLLVLLLRRRGSVQIRPENGDFGAVILGGVFGGEFERDQQVGDGCESDFNRVFWRVGVHEPKNATNGERRQRHVREDANKRR